MKTLDKNSFGESKPFSISTCVCSNSELTKFSWSIPARQIVRIVRASKMQCALRIFDEFSAAFQFPDYLGENWAAFDECINDLSWLSGDGYVLIMRDSDKMLSCDNIDDVGILFKIIHNSVLEWEANISNSSSIIQTAKSFRVILHSTSVEKLNLLKTFLDSRMLCRDG